MSTTTRDPLDAPYSVQRDAAGEYRIDGPAVAYAMPSGFGDAGREKLVDLAAVLNTAFGAGYAAGRVAANGGTK